MNGPKRLKRTKSESIKLAAKPLLQHMQAWGPISGYFVGMSFALCMAAVPALSAPKNASILLSAWNSPNDTTKLQVQVYTCGLLMFLLQSHLIMLQTLFSPGQGVHQVRSAEVVRRQTPAAAGFYTGTAVALFSGMLPVPANGEPVFEIVSPILAPVVIHAFATSIRPLFESRQIGVQRMVQAVGWFIAILVTVQFVAGTGVAAQGNKPALEAVRAIRATMTVLAVCVLVFGMSIIACVSAPRLQRGSNKHRQKRRCFALLLSNGLAGVAVVKTIGGALFILILRIMFASDSEGASLGALMGVLLLNAMFLAAPVELQQAQAAIEMDKAFSSAQLAINATRQRILPGIQSALRHLPVQASKMKDMATALAVAESRVMAAHSIASAAQLGMMRATATVHNHICQPIGASFGQCIDGMLLGVVQDWSHDGVDVLVDCTSVRRAWGVQINAQVYPLLQVVNEAINRAGTDILIYAEERPPILHVTVSVRKTGDAQHPVTLLVTIVQHIRALSDADIDELQASLGARTSTDQRWSHLALSSGSLRSAGGSVRIVGTRCEDLYENGWYCVVATLPLGGCAHQDMFDCCITSAEDRVLGQPLGGDVMMHVAAGLDFCSRLAALRSGHVAVASSIHARSQRRRSAASIASAAQFALQNRERANNGSAGSDRVMSATSVLDLESSVASIETCNSEGKTESKVTMPLGLAVGKDPFYAIAEGEGSGSDSERDDKRVPGADARVRLPAWAADPAPVMLSDDAHDTSSKTTPYENLRAQTTKTISDVAREVLNTADVESKTRQSSDFDEGSFMSELLVSRRSPHNTRSGEWGLEAGEAGRGIFGSGSGGSLLQRTPCVRLKRTKSNGSFILNTSGHQTDTTSSEDSIDVAAEYVVRTVTEAASSLNTVGASP